MTKIDWARIGWATLMLALILLVTLGVIVVVTALLTLVSGALS